MTLAEQISAPRGIRNNNPGNIRHSPVKWVGQAADQPDPDFVTFTAPEYGIRAICRLLLNYQQYDHCKTIRQLISRWAPPTENDTGAYVDDCARAGGRSPDETVNVRLAALMGPLVTAIIRHENGQQPYPASLILGALTLAGIGPTPQPDSTPAQGQPAAA